MFNSEFVYTIIVVGIITLALILLIFVLFKTNAFYDTTRKRWRSGLKFPGMRRTSWDEFDDAGFRRFIVFNTVLLILAINIPTIIYIDKVYGADLTTEQMVNANKLYLSILLIAALIPLVLVFSNYKEKYIFRVNSRNKKSQQIIPIILTIICAVAIAIILLH